MQTHISFSLRSRAFSANLRECLQDSILTSVGVTARQRRLLSSAAAASSERAAALILRSRCDLSWVLQHFFPFSKRAISKRAISKRAPRATGVFLKMASRSCVSGCGRFLASSDGHGRCLLCLGYQHAESALVDESCSQGGNMTIATLRFRYLPDKRGGIPLAMPRSSSSGSEGYFGSWSG